MFGQQPLVILTSTDDMNIIKPRKIIYIYNDDFSKLIISKN